MQRSTNDEQDACARRRCVERSPSAAARALLVEIARCPEMVECLDADDVASPCRSVVLDQWRRVSELEQRRTRWQREHRLPEPWVGHLETAPVLFVSSNPSIDGPLPEAAPPLLEYAGMTEHLGHSSEVHASLRHPFRQAKATWAPDEIVDRAEFAFELWIRDGIALRRGGQPKVGPASRYWISVRARAHEILARQPDPGVDYALTEVVHCKSEGEVGVPEAAGPCADRYLARILEHSGACLLVAFGRVAERAIDARWPGLSKPLSAPTTIESQNRRVLFLPHPNSRTPGSRSIASRIGSDALGELRDWVGVQRMNPRRTP